VLEPAFGNPPEHALKYPSEMSTRINADAEAKFRRGLCADLASFTPVSNIASASAIIQPNGDPGNRGTRGIDELLGAAAFRAVVVSVIVVLAPALTEVGLNAAPVPAGNPVVEKVTELTKVPTAAVAIVNVADWPAGIVCGPVGLDILKSPMLNVSAFDVPPPGVGLNTVTEAVPEVAMLLAGTAAVNCVALPIVVVSAALFHFTTEPLMKFVPVSASVKAAPPAVAEAG
jgi:hypothetical protein